MFQSPIDQVPKPKRLSSKVQKDKLQSEGQVPNVKAKFQGQGQVAKSCKFKSSNSKVMVMVKFQTPKSKLRSKSSPAFDWFKPKFNIDQSATSSLFHIQPSYGHKKSLKFYYHRCNPLLIKAIKHFITGFSKVVKFMQISIFIILKFYC